MRTKVFQRWKSEPDRWLIVEVYGGVVLGTGSVTRNIEQAQLLGAEWAGPITPELYVAD